MPTFNKDPLLSVFSLVSLARGRVALTCDWPDMVRMEGSGGSPATASI